MNKKNWGVDEINLPTKRRVAAITRKELENRAESTAKKKNYVMVQNAFGQIRTGDLSRVRRTD